MDDGQTKTSDEPNLFKPGDTVSPGGSATPAEQPAPPDTPTEPKASESPAPGQESSPPTQPVAEPDATQNPAEPAPVPFTDDEGLLPTSNATVEWTASEFVAHDKNSKWYGLLGLATAVLAGITYLSTRDFVPTGAVVFCGVIFGVYAARPPRQLQYRLDSQGLHIGSKTYPYGQFRSFAVVDEDAFSSIIFMPLRRFSPPLTIYYDPADEPTIADVLADRLPMENHKPDPVDRLMRRIRF